MLFSLVLKYCREYLLFHYIMYIICTYLHVLIVSFLRQVLYPIGYYLVWIDGMLNKYNTIQYIAQSHDTLQKYYTCNTSYSKVLSIPVLFVQQKKYITIMTITLKS